MWKARRFHSVPRHDRVVVFRPCRADFRTGSVSPFPALPLIQHEHEKPAADVGRDMLLST